MTSLRPFFGHWSLEDREGQEEENSRPLEVRRKWRRRRELAAPAPRRAGGSDEQDFSHLR